MKNNLVEIILSVILIGLLLFFIDSFSIFMPHSMHPFMVPLLVLLFVIFTAFVWKETPGDERSQLHKFIASRFAYFSGILILVVGIIAESLHGNVDIWLIIAVCVMLITKTLGLIYGYLKH